MRTGTEESTLVSEQVFLALKITWGKARISVYCCEVHQSLWNKIKGGTNDPNAYVPVLVYWGCFEVNNCSLT